MSKASGLVLIAAGIVVAVYMMPSETDEVEQAQAHGIVVAKVEPAAGVVKVSAVGSEIIPPVPRPAVRPARSDDAKAKPVVITIAHRDVRAPAHSGPVAAAILPGDRVGLTRELQRQLKRVGCYDGEINGMWTPASRRAMKTFTDRVNATLPVEEADYILLTLVRGSPERVCGMPCPAGQVAAEDGRCLPNAVVAQVGKKPVAPALKPEPSGWSTTTTAEAARPPALPDGRMALAGPAKDPLAVRSLRGDEPAASVKAPKPVDTGGWSPPRGGYDRKPKAVEKSPQRYVTAPRQKFGPAYFSERYRWN